MKFKIHRGVWLALIVLLCLVGGELLSQVNQSGGAGSSVTINAALPAGSNLIGKVGIDQTTPGTTNRVDIGNIPHVIVDTAPSTVVTNANLDVALSTRLKPADTLAGVTTVAAVTAITNALPTGTNVIGYIKQRPTGCTAAGTSDVVHDTVGVATGAGTSVSAVTGCILECYVNNITNSPVTFRLADKTGTPIIWVGGNADFSIPANSNMGCGGNGGLNIAGISFASGITAIAGTASALNLHLVARE